MKEAEMHDHKKRGYFNNMVTALPVAPDTKLLPFFYPFAPAGTSGAVTGFALERIDGDLNVLQTYTLSTAYITITNNGVNQAFIYNANYNLLASFTSFIDGIFRFKITLASSIVFYSEIFEINHYKTLPITSGGDFSIYDFNDDFFL
jgi:hypothetical protein